MPQEILDRIGAHGETYGKLGGTGLGLSYVKEKLEEWGGQLSVESSPSIGTSVVLCLPKANVPDTVLKEFRMKDVKTVLLVDDDPAMHAAWNKVFSESKPEVRNLKIEHYYATDEFIVFLNSIHSLDKTYLLLIDQEFAGSASGLDIISKYDLEDFAILVTSHYNDLAVIERAATLKVKVVGKQFISKIPMVFD